MSKYKTDEESLNKIKKRLRDRRTELGYIQAEVAQKIDMGDGDSSSRTTLTTWENIQKNKSPILPGLIPFMSLCNVLDVDADYLLGVSDSVSTDIAKISPFLHLSEETVYQLQKHTEYGSIIDALVCSDSFYYIAKQIKQLVYMEWLEGIITNAFTPSFAKKMDNWFEDYLTNTFPMDMSPDSFKKYLTNRLPFKSDFRAGTFLEKNFLKDGTLFIENAHTDFHMLPSQEQYQLILEAIVDISYDYKVSCAMLDLSRKRLSDMLFDIIDKYAEAEVLHIRNNIRSQFEAKK